MLLMVGRTVGLWFAMIFSPIAFITLAVPGSAGPVSYTHLRAHETVLDLVCRLLLEKKTTLTYLSLRL